MKKQIFYKDGENNIYCNEIGANWIEITKEEANLIANPPPTQQEIDDQKKSENIEFLSYESDRTEDAIAKLKRIIDRDIATDEDQQRFDELEIYSIQLMRVSNQTEWPLNPIWPTCPEFFKPKE